jgi:CubicO group peptidase (beta-lactamase class C family)
MTAEPQTRPHRVPLEQWQVGPWNRWAYQHVRELIPTARVSCGPSPSPLPATPTQLGATRFDRGDGTRPTIDEYVAGSWTDGLAVLHAGALVYERYANSMSAESRHLSQSVGKSVVALVVGRLAERGAVDVDVPVADYVPELAGSGYEGATVAHVLDMTAAVDFVEEYAVDFWRYDIACGWHPPRDDAPHRTILEYLPTIGPADWQHGERFHYVSPNTDLLGIVAERAGGRPLAELIAEELWIPMGAEREADLTVDPAGTAVASGGFNATLRDYVRAGALVLGDGTVDGRRVVAREWVRSLGDGDPEVFARDPRRSADWPGGAYARQWWRLRGRTAARGIHGQLIAVDRDAGAVVVILSSWPDAEDPAEQAAQWSLVEAVTTALRS